jgi:hypothetical protein
MNHTAYSCTVPLTTYTSIADSGATAHFVTVNTRVTNKRIAVVLLGIYNPNRAIMYSMHTQRKLMYRTYLALHACATSFWLFACTR